MVPREFVASVDLGHKTWQNLIREVDYECYKVLSALLFLALIYVTKTSANNNYPTITPTIILESQMT